MGKKKNSHKKTTAAPEAPSAAMVDAAVPESAGVVLHHEDTVQRKDDEPDALKAEENQDHASEGIEEPLLDFSESINERSSQTNHLLALNDLSFPAAPQDTREDQSTGASEIVNWEERTPKETTVEQHILSHGVANISDGVDVGHVTNSTNHEEDDPTARKWDEDFGDTLDDIRTGDEQSPFDPTMESNHLVDVIPPASPPAPSSKTIEDQASQETRQKRVVSDEEEQNQFLDVPYSPDTASGKKSSLAPAASIPVENTADLPVSSRFTNILSSPKYTKLVSSGKSPEKSPSSSGSSQKPSKNTQSNDQGAKKTTRNKRVVPEDADEEAGLNELDNEGEELDEDVTIAATSSGDVELASSAPSMISAYCRQTICSRRPFLACFVMFIVSLLITKGIGKSSKNSLSAQSPEDRENPVKQAADENVRRLNAALHGRPGPVIISTVGSNGEGMKAVQMVLSALGMRIPDRVPFSGLILGTKNGTVVKAKFKRVLGGSLNPERRLGFDERSVADSAGLVEWHIGRAFVTGYVNATLKTIPEDHRQDRWAFAHARAGYLLPYFKSVFGAENFVFVHVVSNGISLASKVYEEFRHMCEYLRYSDFCEENPENKLMFWSQVTKDAFQWSKSRLDVDRYVAIRAEDFTQGNKKCIGRVAKALGLKFTEEELEAAAAVGLKSVDQIEGGDDTTLKEIVAKVETLPTVKKELSFWGYDPADPNKMVDCERMSWV